VPGSRKQDRFGFGAKRFGNARKQDVANDLGTGRAAGFPREHNLEAERFQPLRQCRCVGRLTAAFAAFEGNEMSAHSTWSQPCCSLSPLAPGLGFTRVRSLIDWSKSDI